MGINYYSILNLKRHCTKDEIHKAFGKLIKSQVQNCCLVMLCEAYEVLSDPFRRALYNQYGEEGIKKGVKTDDLYIGPWTYHRNVKKTYSEYCALNNPITNLFMKSNGLVVMDLKKIKGKPDIEKLRLQLTLNEIFNGSIKLIKLKKKSNFFCDSMENEKQVLKIKIPRGFPTGGTIKSEISKPDIGHDNIKKDLPHKVFKRENMNLIVVQKVLLKQVLLGFRIVINTLDNKVLRINITEGITENYVKIIHNEGMPDMNFPSKRGDIIIRFDIIYPLYSPITDEKFCELFDDENKYLSS